MAEQQPGLVAPGGNQQHTSPTAATARPIRIGLVTPCLHVGGAERWMLDLIRHTPDVHWMGCACCGNSIVPAMVAEMRSYVPVHGFTEESIRSLLTTTDVLVCWGPNSLDRAIPVDYPGKVVVVSHAASVPWTADVIRGGMSRATHWVAVSKWAKQPYEGLVDLDKVTVLPNGIDPERCVPRQAREETRRAIGLAPDDIVVGSLGRLATAKRPLLVAQAVAQLGPPYRALFAGSWLTREVTPQQLEQTLSGRLTLLHESIEIADLLAAIDVFVLASESEGFGLAVCEALYAGVRVVSSPVGVLIDIVAEHGVQWEEIATNATADDLASAIRAAAAVPASTLDRRTAVMRRAIEEKYLASDMGCRWGKYLQRITGSGETRRPE